MKYKRETGLAADAELEFSDINADDFKKPTLEILHALDILKKTDFFNDYYLVDKDFFDWIVKQTKL